MRVLSIGEILWDVYPDRKTLGGAPFNFATNIHRLGNASALITGLGNDELGAAASEIIRELGWDAGGVQIVNSASTGTVRVELDGNGVPEFTIRRPAAYDRMALSDEVMARALAFQADWMYYGTLLHTNADVERFTWELVRRSPGVRCLYDVNLRKDNWNIDLVKRLCSTASVLKVNETEAETLFTEGGLTRGKFTPQGFCSSWTDRYGFEAVCITLGPAGCLVFHQGEFSRSPGYPITPCDTVGSGDAFAAGFLHGYHHGWPILDCARFANALGAIVATRAGAIPAITLDEGLSMAATAEV